LSYDELNKRVPIATDSGSLWSGVPAIVVELDRWPVAPVRTLTPNGGWHGAGSPRVPPAGRWGYSCCCRGGPRVHNAGRVPQAREDVVDGELRVVGEHLRGGEPLGEQAEDGRDRDADAAHAGHPTHDAVVDGDAIHRDPHGKRPSRQHWSPSLSGWPSPVLIRRKNSVSVQRRTRRDLPRPGEPRPSVGEIGCLAVVPLRHRGFGGSQRAEHALGAVLGPKGADVPDTTLTKYPQL